MTFRVCGHCENRLPAALPTGRPRAFCGAACRKRAHRERERNLRAKLADRENWWTPDTLRQRLLSEWNITLDAAATVPSRLVPAYFGPDHIDPERRDALAVAVSWAEYSGGGVVYLNPPYATLKLRRFLSKAVETSRTGTQVVGLIPASTDTKWWQEYVTIPGAEIEFLVGRLRFGGPHASGNPAMFGSALVVWK